MLDIETLRSVIEGLAKPAQLDDHPLASAQFVADYLNHHPEKRSLPPGKCLGWDDDFIAGQRMTNSLAV